MSRTVILAVSSLIGLLGCAPTGGPSGSGSPYAFLKITDQITGWIQKTPADSNEKVFAAFADSTGLRTIIDGGAGPFIRKGMRGGIQQIMDGQEDREMKALLVDFGNPDSARRMFVDKTQFVTDPRVIAGLDSSVALVDTNQLDGVTAHAHFGDYYLWLQLSGYGHTDGSVAKDSAYADAVMFVQYYQSKMH